MRTTMLWIILVTILLALPCQSASGKLSEEDLERLKSLAANVNLTYNIYPELAWIIERDGPIPLARDLLARQEPELVQMGLKVFRFHRLVMLKAEVGRLADESEEPLQSSARQAMLFAGVPFEEALASVTKEDQKSRVVRDYALSAAQQWEFRDRNYNAMLRLIADEKRPLSHRRSAWFALAGAPYNYHLSGLLMDLDEWLRWAEKLDAPAPEIAFGLARFSSPEATFHLRPYLKSTDSAARALAAFGLASRRDPDAVRVLIDLLPEFDRPEPLLWHSVGQCAFQGLLNLDNSILIRLALDGLVADGDKAIVQIVGDQVGSAALDALVKFMVVRDAEGAQQRKAVGELLKQRIAGQSFLFEETTELRYIGPREPFGRPQTD